MPDARITRVGMLAIGIAVIGGVIALINVFSDYRRSGLIDWGHLALAIGVPVLMYAIVKNSANRQS